MVTIEAVDARIQGIVLNDIRTCWIIRDKKTILIESGFPAETPLLLSGLDKLSLTPGDIDFLCLTHIHIDHAGGAGYLVKKNPAMKVFVHQKGVHHLSAPERLNTSVKKAYGDRFAAVGEILAIPESNLVPVDTGDTLDLGGSRVSVYYTPGHAKHHVVYYDETSGSVFPGDAMGSQYKGLPNFVLSPPSDYDKELAKTSIDRIRGLAPKRINFTHCGSYDMRGREDFYQNLKDKHDLWNTCVLDIVRAAPSLGEKEIFERFLEEMPELKNYPSQFFSFNLSVRGILIYLKKAGMIA
jgi:glyoxylase-like metal-dependent hydrolase (beta-lactamase superfamily II)